MDLLLYCEGESMIPVDLSANCEGRICDPNGSGMQILGILVDLSANCEGRIYDPNGSGIHGHVCL